MPWMANDHVNVLAITHRDFAIVCAWCRETLGVAHSDAVGGTYSICPTCVASFFPDDEFCNLAAPDAQLVLHIPAQKQFTHAAEGLAKPELHRQP